ncbi:hypothetical protein KSP40_PGU008258 [Platanthera guangdongensis]|uniref:Uncharacterized protein n=1 Tax=Platanthera guangdongensis TaxID=2320717 RepID=A0ABR2MV08_9ASPA
MAEFTAHAMTEDLCSACSDTSEEESGWTFYFDEFLASKTNEAQSSISTPSMLSDAASYVARKYTLKADASLKIRKAVGVPCVRDDSLEDTACSPQLDRGCDKLDGGAHNIEYYMGKEEIISFHFHF